ncbi:hypothetical protein CROQUDRAFT_580008 [Cronartium quercuum f. sp. fusiforme G11]|uniref:RNase H type-1 domain-containing protein n=1 Tax=Cronartium quercuum f. sp. fusiforme G11 TaxID=708437 RepID=A0A9P6NGP5_9BASI|nr:hypothetical protein CROQUDRAFT_580008 [Cronartium quercuum f. sp. fusiforme G11]
MTLGREELVLANNDAQETIYPHPDAPWKEPEIEVRNMGEDRTKIKEKVLEQIEMKKAEGACIIFTDGSFKDGVGAGAAAVTEQEVARHAYGPSEGISNNEVAAMGLAIALIYFRKRIQESPEDYSELAIFSDSQTALNLLAKPLQPTSLQYLARFLKKFQ